jgi:tetratricopeptide (TPR) repeat protein
MAGDRQGAIEACRASVSQYRGLPGDLKRLRAKEFGIALYTLSAQEIESGDANSGLTLSREGIDFLSEANADNDFVLLDVLAAARSNAASALERLGRFQEACASNTEAIRTYERLQEVRPDVHFGHLSRVLNNQGNVLAALGRRAEAHASIQRAVEIRRGLAARWPARFSVSLGRSLTNLASRLSEQTDISLPLEALDSAGQDLRRRAIDCAKEAVLVLRAARDAGLPHSGGELAMAQRNLAIHFQRGSRYSFSQDAAAKAVREYRQLEEAGVTGYAGAMVEALVIHAEALLLVNNERNAAKVAKEALGRARSLHQRNPTAHEKLVAAAGAVAMKCRLIL